MNKTKNSISKRILSLLLSILLVTGSIPMSVYTAFAGDVNYGEYQSITTGADITSSSDKTIDVTYSNVTLVWQEADASAGISKAGWYIQATMTSPSGFMNEADFKVDSADVVTYTEGCNGELSSAKSYWDNQTTDSSVENIKRTVSLNAYVDEQILNDAVKDGGFYYEYKFNWNSNEQTLRLKLADNIKLEKNGDVIYPSDNNGIVAPKQSGFTASSSASNYVVVNNVSSAVVEYNEGYKLGIEVKAPSNLLTQSDFENVTYQSFDSSVWDSAQSFWDNQATDSTIESAQRSVDVYASITVDALDLAQKNGETLKYYWRFDFDKDGVYEQYVELEVNPSNITLTKDGYQVYPKLGNVTSIDGASVIGDETGNVEVVADSLTLDYKTTDAGAGIVSDGWWTGIVINAPELDASVLENAKYQIKEYKSADWSAVKSFWDDKSSADSDTTHNIKENVKLDRTILSEALDSGEDIVFSYRFDWNNDGAFEQLVTYRIVPSDSIVLNKIAQTNFKFVNEAPIDQIVGDKFTNKATGGQSSGEVVYSIKSGTEFADIDANTGEVTFKKAGKVVVLATKAADDVYDQATAEYTVTSIRTAQSSFSFETTGPVVQTYAENKKYTNNAVGGSGDGEISYRIVNGSQYADIDSATGEVTIKKAGEVTIEAKKAQDDKYYETTATYILQIKKADQSVLSFTTVPENNEIAYSELPQYSIIEATGGNGTGEITYSVISNPDVATVTSDGVIKTLKTGQFTVQAVKAEDDCYNESQVAKVTLTVVKGTQAEIMFDEPAPSSIDFNTNNNEFTNAATGGSGSGAISYSVITGSSFATVDEFGKVTFTKAGLIQICATREGDDNYNEKKAYYSLVVNKANQSFSFSDGSTVKKYYGIKSYTNEIVYDENTSVPDSKGYGDGAVNYTIASNTIGATVNATTGEVKFSDSQSKTGVITVTAKKLADDCYNEVSKTYRLVINYIDSPSVDDFTVTGEKIIDDSEWYTGNVSIKAPDGYSISYNDSLSNTDWSSSVDYNVQGKTTPQVYLKDADGYITQLITLPELKIDLDNPTVSIEYSASLFSRVIELVTFSVYKSDVVVTLKAENSTSSVEKFTYNYNGVEKTVERSEITFDGAKASYQFTISPQYRGKVSMTATAASGRSSNLDDENVIVVDTVNPELTVDYEYSTAQSYREYNSVIYSNDSVKVIAKINEANFDISEEPQITVNGVSKEVSWTQDASGKYLASFYVEDDGNNNIKISFSDIAQNKVEYEKDVFIDRQSPQLVVTYDNNDARNSKYFAAPRKATVKITDASFNPSDFDYVVVATDINGATVQTEDYTAKLKDAANWSKNGDEYTANVEFTKDANYSITCNYTDLAGNEMPEYTDTFTPDTAIPTNLKIEYSTPLIEKFIDMVTLGFYKEKVTVTLSADDATSGIDYFEWKYDKELGSSNVNAPSTSFAKITPDDKNNAKVSFELPANAKGRIVAKAYDMAGNNVEKSDSNRVVVVDNISPVVNIDYTSSATAKYVNASMNDVSSFAQASTVYFNDTVRATITVDEANFFEGDTFNDGVCHEVGILLTMTDNDGNETLVEYLPVGAQQIYPNATPKYIEWTDDKDLHYFTIDYTQDADYVLKLEYSDFSNNQASVSSNDGASSTNPYISKTVTVDTQAPEIEVTYSPYEVKQSIDGFDYLDQKPTATIKVTEHNFRADEIAAVVTAKDVSNADVSVPDYAAYLSNRANWSRNGNVYTANISYDVEAKYTFDISYTDLASNEADDYTEDKFVVDETAPTDLEVSYSTPLLSKTIGLITFGYYKEKVEVTIKASDDIAGVDFFEYSYTKEEGTSEINADSFGGLIPTENITYSDGGKTATAKFDIPANARGYVSFRATDRSDNKSVELADINRINVVDNIAPTRTVEYNPELMYNKTTMQKIDSFTEADNDNVILYYHDTAVVTFKIDEANFYEEDVIIEVNGERKYPTDWTQSGDLHTGTITLTGDGDYIVKMSYIDRSENVMDLYTSPKIAIDSTAPEFDVEYTDADGQPIDITADKYQGKDVYANITVTEHNFRADDIVSEVSAMHVMNTDIAEKDEVAQQVQQALTNRSSWTHEGDVHKATVKFSTDARYVLTLKYADIIGNNAEEYKSSEYVVDHVAPSQLEVSYSEHINFWDKVLSTVTLGYYSYKEKVEVTIKASDDIAGVDFFKYSYTQEDGTSEINTDSFEDVVIPTENITYSENGKTATAKFVIPANARGHVSFTATDRSGNESVKLADTNRINVVDKYKPTRTVDYTPEKMYNKTTMQEIESFTEEDNNNVILYYHDTAVVTFNIDEANFYEEDVIIKINGERQYPSDWKQSGDLHTGTITITGEGDYIVTMSYMDRSENEMDLYTSPKIAIDSTAPKFDVKYTDADGQPIDITDSKYQGKDVYANITVTEHNFRADDMVSVVSAMYVMNTDIAEKDEVAQQVQQTLTNRSSWTHEGDVHKATVKFSTDARYVLTLNYADIIGNKAEEYKSSEYVVDHVAPSQLEVSYSEHINFWEKVVNAVTFGYYSYKDKVEVTIKASDDVAGVDFFEYSYTQEAGTSEINTDSFEDVLIPTENITYSENGKTATAKFVIPANARGHVSFTATDRSGNESVELADTNRINVVDNVTPNRIVEYSTPAQIVDAATLKTLKTYNEDTAAILYYNDDVTVTFKIDEANFYEEDVVIKVNGERQYPSDWKHSGDLHTGTIKLSAQGDYVITMSYSDRSTNAIVEYESQAIVIDRTAPIVSVEYPNMNAVETNIDRENNERLYLDKPQNAIVTIKEHNFRADDVVIKVNAWNSKGENIGSFTYDANDLVSEYMQQGQTRSEWSSYNTGITSKGVFGYCRRYDDTYKLYLSYNAEANYTFDIEYKDLAKVASTDQNKKYFTVDTVNPSSPRISYSEPILDKVIETLSFGYYQPKVITTITADDATSGVSRFRWKYTKQEGTSSVNADSTEYATITARNITYSNSGQTATCQFEIPANARGYISAQVVDWSDNLSDSTDADRINVVDNIKPEISVSYNAPVRNVNGVDYYEGDIQGTIVINEANFYSQDVVVSATRDNNAVAVDVTWSDNSVDEHVGVFTLSDDGDYIVTVEYTDRSNNEMTRYTSNQLTRDTQIPAISVSNVVSNSANKDEVYGFTITASDTNINPETFTPVLESVSRDEQGQFVTSQINLGEMSTVEAGKTYSFTVENLPDDALYTLKASVADYSNNSTDKFALQDATQYDQVQFSVNRHGSIFVVDDPTDKVMNQYYVNSVVNNVVIKEINVDPIENYTVKLNGNTLTEITDYTTSQTSNNGEWSIRTYSVNNSLFSQEGEYTVTVESVDKAQTTAYSDVKNLDVSFVVDKTAPALTITGLEQNGRYQVEEQEVTLIPTDDGGRLNSLKVIVYDSDGNPKTDENSNDISVRFDMQGEEFLEYLSENSGRVKFTIPNGLENKVQIICTDCAIDESGKENEYNQTFEKVTVSQNAWIIFYANKPLFYSTIAVALALVGGSITAVVLVKRKKKSNKQTATTSN